MHAFGFTFKENLNSHGRIFFKKIYIFLSMLLFQILDGDEHLNPINEGTMDITLIYYLFLFI
jgi:hypothetical protein